MKYTSLLFTWLIGLTLLAGCEFDEVVDPNNPDAGSVEQNASKAQLNALATGIIAGIRNSHGVYVASSGAIARELYVFDADPRNTQDLLGKNGTPLDKNTYYLTAPYNDRYQVIKTTNILLEALENTTLVSEEQKKGYRAFANTIKAHQLLQVLNMLGKNGIRIDVADPDNLGEFVSQEQALGHIAGLLDEAATSLADGGVEFAFDLPGFYELAGPTGFYQFNRALAARVAVYRANWSEALTNLDASFFELDKPLGLGPKMVFGTGTADILNPLYKPLENTADMIYAHPIWVADSATGDERIDLKTFEGTLETKDGLSATNRTILYGTSTAPIDIIRNEELILLYAEAQIQLEQYALAIEALNVIRNAYGLDDYSGPETKDALIDEMLEQRRYSLWAEGHRMVDLRRYGRLNSDFLPIDRTGDLIFTEFPIPATENVN